MLACDEAASKRAVGYRGDAKLAVGFQQRDAGVFDVEDKRAIFDLHGRDGMDFVGAAERFRRDFAEAEIVDFPLPVTLFSLDRW